MKEYFEKNPGWNRYPLNEEDEECVDAINRAFRVRHGVWERRLTMPRPDYIWEKPHKPPDWQIAREPHRLQWYRWRRFAQI
eukprot:10968457-Karenia_brevis.AAC.1